MKMDNGRLSSVQIMWASCCFIQATVLRSVYVFSVTGHDSWISAFTGFLAYAPFIAIYTLLMKWFPQKSLFEMNDIVFGKIGGKIFSLIYLFFFINIYSLNLRDVSTFVVDFVMLDTPEWAILVLFTLFIFYAVRKGAESFIRISTIFPLIAFAVVLLNFTLVLKDVDWGFLTPILAQKPIKYIQATHITATIPFGELLVMMMFARNTKKDCKTGRSIFLGSLVAASFMALVTVRDAVTLGPLVKTVVLPSFEAVRTVNVQGVITRTESLYAFLLIGLMFFKLCIVLYACTMGFAQIFELENFKPYVGVLALLGMSYATFVYTSTIINNQRGSNIAPFAWLLFELIMPLATLLVARMRKQHKQNGPEVSPA